MNKNKKTTVKLARLTYKGKALEIPALLVKGNKKIGSKVHHFSTVAGTEKYNLADLGLDPETIELLTGSKETKTCCGTCCCDCPGCYGKTGCYCFRSTKRRLVIRTLLAHDYDFFEKRMIEEIKAKKCRFVRIHATGDFFSRGYALAWLHIIQACPEVTFWTYTKTYGQGFDDILIAINTCFNCNIVSSLVDDCGLNYGHCGYILDTYYKLLSNGEKPHICPCGMDDTKKCSDCTGCSSHKYVLFVEHSTDYKAADDPLLKEVAAIVARQEKQN